MSQKLNSQFSVNGVGITTDPYPRSIRSLEPAKQETSVFVGARSGWYTRPAAQPMNRAAARSRSPISADRQQLVTRSRTPPKPAHVSRYHYIPREHHSPPKLTLNIPPLNRPLPQPCQLSPSHDAQDLPRAGGDSSEDRRPGIGPAAQQSSGLLPRNRPGGQYTALAPLMPKPLAVRRQPAQKPREHVPSMVEYLSLEQLESLWQSQDMYVGTVIAPQKLASPVMLRIVEPPISPIMSVHPAFRDDPQNDPNYNRPAQACV
ncbi:MAG: hypothetical protein LQ340_001486 [Diploschistes diacapsis]|nr:MAG: hypothetical protein LQ340_001486 [Diploschistes diacapsis]